MLNKIPFANRRRQLLSPLLLDNAQGVFAVINEMLSQTPTVGETFTVAGQKDPACEALEVPILVALARGHKAKVAARVVENEFCAGRV